MYPVYNQLITYYLPVRYLLRIQQYPLNTTYNILKIKCKAQNGIVNKNVGAVFQFYW